MRRICIVLGLALASVAHAATDIDRSAYQVALKCFVANGVAKGERRRAGDEAKAAIYDANAERAFNGAVAIGRRMGLTNRQMNTEVGEVSARELPRMMTERPYFLAAVAECRGLGMM